MPRKTTTTRGTSEPAPRRKRPPSDAGEEPAEPPKEERPGPTAPMPRLRGANPVPPQWKADLGNVLITEAELRRRVRELSRSLTRDYVGKDLVVVALLTGTVMFLADLLRHLTIPLRLDFMGVSSYRDGTKPSELMLTKALRLDVKNRDVLLVDDILDTGRTLRHVLDRLHKLRPRSLRTCVLLDKPSRREQPVGVDYTGFVIPDLFVVGYGLDFAERYRNLPFVGVLRPELYAS